MSSPPLVTPGRRDESPVLLVVEDDPNVRELLSNAASGCGVTCGMAATGRRARELIKQRELALALVSDSLPDETGFELVHALRTAQPRAQVLSVLSDPSAARIADALRNGASDWLARPVDPVTVAHRVQLALDRRRLLDEALRMRARLLTAEGMASVGSIAAALAQELDAPLREVTEALERVGEGFGALFERLRASWQRLEERTDEATMGELSRQLAAIDELLPIAWRGASRLLHLSRDLRLVSFRGRPVLAPVDVEELLDVAVALAEPELRGRTQLAKRYGGPPDALGDPERLVQVFANLLVISVKSIEKPEAVANQTVVATSVDVSRRFVLVELSDSGARLSPQALSQVLDPFAAAREASTTGTLGLSSCSALLRALGGALELESLPGGGSLFRVVLPVAPSGFKPRSGEGRPLTGEP